MADRRGSEQFAAGAAPPPGLGLEGPISQPMAAACTGRLLSAASRGPHRRSRIHTAASARVSPPSPGSADSSAASPPSPDSAASRPASASCTACGARRYRRTGRGGTSTAPGRGRGGGAAGRGSGRPLVRTGALGHIAPPPPSPIPPSPSQPPRSAPLEGPASAARRRHQSQDRSVSQHAWHHPARLPTSQSFPSPPGPSRRATQ